MEARLRRVPDGLATLLDALPHPLLNFSVDPADRTDANLYAARKSLFRFQLIDHRSSQAGHLADLRKTQKLNVRIGSGLRIIRGRLSHDVRFQSFRAELPLRYRLFSRDATYAM